MAEKANPFPTNDERVFAMLSHFSIFIGGILLPIIFWAIKKDQSQYVRFHSLQAIFFHIAYFVALMMLIFILFIVIMVMGTGASLTAMDNSGTGAGLSVLMIILMIVFYGGMFVIILGAIGYGVYMGVKSYQGELVMYPIIGKKVYEKVYGETVIPQ
ncbi:MAG: DUF4870 domain-containing protein [Ignavibacteriae bacterium]|nr:DUF4870 domain-containing protein [Ignavibacteriota bacterium]